MSELTDSDLLVRFTQNQSDEAFATVVERHVHLVYSVALRHTANPHDAEEITQAVFIILARKAASLGRETVLSGWLYHTARLTAANFVRSERRRARREQELFMHSTLENSTPEVLWSDLFPSLDGTMARLSRKDRDALVLRHFESMSLSEVGKALGIGERAAQKRVDRALEKLRRAFTKRGFSVSVATVAAEISTRSVQAAPFGLATKITAAASKGSAVAGTTQALVKGTLTVMTWLKVKTAIMVGAATLLTVGAGLAITNHGSSQADQKEANAVQRKLSAERTGGPVNIAQRPNADKYRDEQNALGNQKLNAEQAGGFLNVAQSPDAQKRLDEQKALGTQQNQTRND